MKLVSNVQDWGADVAGVLQARWWSLYLAAIILAAGGAELAYVFLNLPQSYSEFVVGAIAWSYENKFHDYAVLYAFVGAFLAALVVLGTLASTLKRQFGVEGVDQLHDLLLLLCAPAGLWLGGLVAAQLDLLWLLRISEASLIAAFVLGFSAVSRGRAFWQQAEALAGAVQGWLLFSALAALAISAVGVTINRLGGKIHLHRWLTSEDVAFWSCIVGLLAVLLGCCMILRASNRDFLYRHLKLFVFGAQGFMPLFFFCLLPPSWIWTSGTDATLAAGYPVTLWGKALVAGCVIAAYTELHGSFIATADTSASRLPIRWVSLGCAVAILLFLKTPPSGLASVNPDDYHFGEMLVPWWTWVDKGLLPFWDYTPARGFLNYLPGLLDRLLLDGQPASIYATNPFIFALLALVALRVLGTTIGFGAAFVAILLGPYANGVGEIDLVMTIFLAYFCAGYFLWTRARWLLSFAFIGLALLLYAPGQAALTLLACLPLACVVLWQLFSQSPRRLLDVLLLILGLLAVAGLLTPLGKMVLGALRYGAEQSSINSIAHGINWSASFGEARTNPWVFEAMRAAWVLVILVSGVLILQALMLKSKERRAQILVYATPIFLVLLLFVVRSAGRIDGGGSRLALEGNWALALLLPLVLYAAIRVRSGHILLWITLAGLVTPYWGGLAASEYAKNFDPVQAAGFGAANHADNGTRFGRALVNKESMDRIDATRRVLDAVLERGETYLDLTGRHAMYYYVDRAPPVECGSMYNLVGERQQMRAIESIRKLKLPAILLSSENVTHDGGPSSLRSNLVYRAVLLSEGYQIATIGKQVWMIREDRLRQLDAGIPERTIGKLDASPDGPLMAIFKSQDLKSVPASWGRSIRSLKKKTVQVLDIPAARIAFANDVERIDPETFQVKGQDPFVRFDISDAHVRGRDAGLLRFDLACELSTGSPPLIVVYWATRYANENDMNSLLMTGHSGTLVVPVDSSPGWLLADRINSVRVDIENSAGTCERFSIRHVELLRRSAAESK